MGFVVDLVGHLLARLDGVEGDLVASGHGDGGHLDGLAGVRSQSLLPVVESVL